MTTTRDNNHARQHATAAENIAGARASIKALLARLDKLERDNDAATLANWTITGETDRINNALGDIAATYDA